MGYQKLLPPYFKDPITVVLLLGGIAILSFAYFFRKRNVPKLPPGPSGVPILGYYPFLGKFPPEKFNELAKKYGNVFSFYVGPKYFVVLNNWTAAKDGLGQDSSLDRPPAFFSTVPYNFGVVGANGPEWHQTRRLSTRIIKDTGLNRTGWEDLIKEEALDLANLIAAEDDRPLDVQGLFQDSFTNNVLTLVLGERVPSDHPLTKMIGKSVNDILQNIPVFTMKNFSPYLCRILQFLGFEKQVLEFEMVQELGEFVSDTVDERLQKSDETSGDSFIGRYQKEIQNYKKSNKTSHITMNTLKGDTVAMLTGGGDTMRNILVWTLIALADLPEVQSKVHDELDAAIGREGSIRWEERHKVPYTLATLLEAMRWKTIAPIPTPRLSFEDMHIQGYHIPKGTYILPNLWAMNNDPEYWKNPEEFHPERFLTDDGKKVNSSPESFAAFSYGKRNCPGRLLAYMIGLLYLTAIMQKFKVLPKEGKKVKYDVDYGLSYQAANVELRFIPR